MTKNIIFILLDLFTRLEKGTEKGTDLKRLIPTQNVYYYCLVFIIVCYHFTV